MAGNLRRTLTERGLIHPGQPGQQDQEWSYTTWPSSEPPTYKGELPPWSDEMTRAKEEYRVLDGQLVGARDELGNLRRQKVEEDAQRLWDQAEELDS